MTDRSISRTRSGSLIPVLAILLVGGMVLLAGCARKTELFPPGMHPRAQDVWERFESGGELEPSFSALDLSASLNYSGPGRKGRVVLHFWGNLNYPLRLDVRTGLGPIVAYCREDAGGFLAYVPSRKSAWLFPDGKMGMAAFGVELPFTLKQLGLILAGRAGEVFPEGYASATLVPEQGFEYVFFEELKPAKVLVDFFSRPLRWTGAGEIPWRIEFGRYKDTQDSLPVRLKFFRGEVLRAILSVKDAELLDVPWDEKQMELAVPRGVPIRLGSSHDS